MSSLLGLTKTFPNFLILPFLLSRFLLEAHFLHLRRVNLSMIIKYFNLFVCILWKLVSSNGRVTCLLTVRKESIKVFLCMAGMEFRKDAFLMHKQLLVYEFCIANFFNIARIYFEFLFPSVSDVRLGDGRRDMRV